MQLHEAVAQRRTAPLPRVGWIIVAVVCCTIAYIGLSLVLVPSDEPREFHFVSEEGAVAALSAFFLAGASMCSLASLVTIKRVRDSHAWVWMLLAVGFAFLSFDEMLLFHERVGRLTSTFVSSGSEMLGWNDIFVILYGIVALPLLVAMMPGLLRWRLVPEAFAIAFVMYAVHTLVDSISAPPTPTSIVIEESAKLFCGAFLALGALFGFIGVLWKHTRPMGSDVAT